MAKRCSKFLKNIWSCSLSRLMYQKLCFSLVAILYISLSNLRLTNASNASKIVNNSFEFRSRQISIQQKFVRQMRETTLNFWVNNQHAQPRWRPRTNKLVRIFVELCITLSPWSAKSSMSTRTTYPFLCFFAFKCALTFLCLSMIFQSVRFPPIPHRFPHLVLSSPFWHACAMRPRLDPHPVHSLVKTKRIPLNSSVDMGPSTN